MPLYVMADDHNVLDYIDAATIPNGASVASWALGTTPDLVLTAKDDDGMRIGAQSIGPPATNVRGLVVVWKAIGVGPGGGGNEIRLTNNGWNVGAKTDWVRGGAANYAYGLIAMSPRGALGAPRDRPSRFINPGEVGMVANWIGPASNQAASMSQPVNEGITDEATATDWNGTLVWPTINTQETMTNLRVVYVAQISDAFTRTDFDNLATIHGVTADREPF